ncbi:hypothetical protein CXG81DRAFT_29685 [Caulochytrium protostelioides]|uniref:Protein ARV n=1 Tax=Caulochytrium protostelioides TaxID=1555241 RepID=A0A4P9X9I8_9FUNG|nr:hypothetical protein CXG81DRAFT_29685 [Caulochytrium protostelioides]|eukprot:RKP01750.1 hypothetical protein CXG81DRAFT_29685 [Caulochytrium protostelioides]
MVLCIECGSPVKSLWTQYGPGNLRLTQCRRCHHFADKYIENDNIIVFLDLVLHKRPVYRHMLFNGRIVFDDDGLNPNVIRMGILLILFDVFEMWFHIELVYGNDHFPPPGVSVVRQYLWLLMLAFLTEVLRHALVRLAIWLWLLLIIMVIWNYHELVNAWFVHAFVVGSNTEALSVLLGISWLETLPIILAGASSTWIVRGIGSYWDPTLRVLIDGLVPILTV